MSDYDQASLIDTEVGRRVRMMRERRKMSQSALGEALGVSFQQIQKYERGANRISASALVLIAKALQVGVVHFLEGLDGGHAVSSDPLVDIINTLGGKGRRCVFVRATQLQAEAL